MRCARLVTGRDRGINTEAMAAPLPHPPPVRTGARQAGRQTVTLPALTFPSSPLTVVYVWTADCVVAQVVVPSEKVQLSGVGGPGDRRRDSQAHGGPGTGATEGNPSKNHRTPAFVKHRRTVSSPAQPKPRTPTAGIAAPPTLAWVAHAEQGT